MASENSCIEKSSTSLDKFKSFTYKWTIVENLLTNNSNYDHCIESNIFSYSSDDPIKFKIRIFPNRSGLICLCLVSSIDEPINVYFKIWIPNEKNGKRGIKSFKHTFKDSTNYFKDYSFFSDLNHMIKNYLLNENLILFFEINIPENKTEIYNSQNNLFENTTFTKIIKANSFKYKWNIDKFNSILNTKKNKSFIESGLFYCPHNEQTKFVLQFYPNGYGEDIYTKDFMSLILKLQTCNTYERTVQYKFSIMDRANNEVCCKENTISLSNGSMIYVLRFIKKNEFHSRENELLHEDTLTIICELEVHEDEFLYKEIPIPTLPVTSILDNLNSSSNNTSSKTYTHLDVVKFGHTWTIDNFKVFFDEQLSEKPFLESEQFFSPNDNPIRFNLRIYPRGYEKRNEKFVSIFLILANGEQRKATVECRISIANGKEEKCFPKVFKGVIDQETTLGLEQFIPRNTLLNQENEFLPDGKLTIFCEVGIVGDSKVNFEDIPSDQALPSVIGQDFGRLLESGKYSDVVFMVEGQEIRAHKAFLTSRSPVFEAMFRNDMIESNENHIEIIDIGYEVFRDLLSYIYSGKYQPKDQNIADLFVAADKYNLEKLKNLCENSLCSLVNRESVATLLTFAETYSAYKLKTTLFDYINLQASWLMENENFTNKISKQLIIELYNDMKKKQNF